MRHPLYVDFLTFINNFKAIYYRHFEIVEFYSSHIKIEKIIKKKKGDV